MHNSDSKIKSKAVQSLLDKFRYVDVGGSKSNFKFPPPPPIHDPRLSPVCNSDSSSLSESAISTKKPSKPSSHGKPSCRERGESESDRLPPIGVFWDIENCQIPHGKSALTVVQAIRNTFFDEYREAEFTVVCDVHKESPVIIQELNDAQVDLLHVISSSKNAADEKLRQAIRRFADLHGSQSTIILISSDINFAPDLSDLRHRKKIHVILLHSINCSESLIMCANEHYNFADFVLPLPNRNQQIESQSADIFVWNLPMTQGDQKIRWKLKALSQNCGGRIIVISRPMAVLRFPTVEMALRAQKRMDGELVFGQAIRVGISHFMDPPVSFDNNYTDRSRGNYLSSLHGNHGSTRDFNNSSFLPINPNPWIYQNGASAISDTWNTPSRPIEDTRDSQGLNSSFGNHHYSPWNSRDEDKSGMSYGYQPVVSDVENHPTITVNHPNTVEEAAANSLDRTLERNSFPVDGASNAKNGWNATPTFTTAFVEPRDWAENNKKRRSSPVPNSTSSNRKSLESGWNPMKNTGSNRKCRTPSPYMFNSKLAHPLAVKPERQLANTSLPNNSSPKPQVGNDKVELYISNLDQSIDPAVMKKILLKAFSEYVRVGSVSVFVQPDQNFAAVVEVSTIHDAQLAISRLHRRKIGSKRLIISQSHPNQQQNVQYIRWQIITLLQNVPQYVLPLVKFLKMFEARYVTSITVSDLLKMKDVCTVIEESNGRMVSLNSEFRDVQSPTPPASIENVQLYCEKHFSLQTNGKGWAELETPQLPNVMIPLPVFAKNIKALLASHFQVLPLNSLFSCYVAECGPLQVDEQGVPLEHYVTCINQVELAISDNGIKYLRHCSNELLDVTVDGYPTSVSPSLVNNLNSFGREVVDLLKTHHHCQLLFNKFIPAYHHRFGRQCRVADYGFTKLIDLLDAVPHVLQVIGEGNKRIVTLTHRVQIRRFTADIIRTLRSQPMKRMSLAELPSVFEKILGRPFDPVDYGLCTLDDLVEHLSDCAVLVNQGGVLSIPKKKQTTDEVKRTKQFAQEVIEIISHVPKCSITFDQFIPAYHHHYNHQCRVTDYGFTKLIELFEAIPDTVKLDEDSNGRQITLTLEKKLMVLSEQMMDLVYPFYPPGMSLNMVESRYLWHYGYTLDPSTYSAASIELLMDQLSTVKVVVTEDGKMLVPLDEALLKQITSIVKGLLLNADSGRMTLAQLRSHFSVNHEQQLTPRILQTNMPDVVQVDEEDGVIIVELTPLYQFIRQLVMIITKNEGVMTLGALQESYVKEYKRAPNPMLYGFATIEDLINQIPNLFVLREKGRRDVRLNKELSSSLRKASNTQFRSGSAVCRPPSSSDYSSTSDSSNVEAPSWKKPQSNSDYLSVVLPEMPPTDIAFTAYSLFSPYKGIFPPIQAPDPSELPLPNLVAPSTAEKEEQPFPSGSTNSMNTSALLNGGGPSSNCSSTHSGNDSVATGSGKRRTKRLAAQFNLPLNVD